MGSKLIWVIDNGRQCQTAVNSPTKVLPRVRARGKGGELLCDARLKVI